MSVCKRFFCFIVAIFLFAGCAAGESPAPATESATAAATEAATTTAAPTTTEPATTEPAAPKFATAIEYAVPEGSSVDDIVARVETAMDSADYSYDDLSAEYSFDIIASGWQADPFPENDPVKQWFKEKLNINVNATCYVDSAERDQQITLRYASANPPDFANFNTRTTAVKLYQQGVILDDWTPYLDKIPTYVAQIHAADVITRTLDGKLFSLASHGMGEGNIWQTWIRQDWLNKLGLDLPKTPDAILDAARRFTFEDPDGNGIDDTWGFSDCAGGAAMSWLHGNLRNIFAYTEVQVVNGAAVPFAIAPQYKEALGFAATAVSEGLIDPDWYTQDWLGCYNKIRAGQIGVIYMWEPGAMTVIEAGSGSGAGNEPNKKANGEVWQFEDWSLLEVDGYRTTDSWLTGSGYWVASKQISEDEGKMNRLLHYIDYMTSPNEGGFTTGIYMGQAGGQLIEAGIGRRGDYSIVDPIVLNNYRAMTFGSLQVDFKKNGLLPWFAGDEEEFQIKVMNMLDRVNALPFLVEYKKYTSEPAEMASMFTDLTTYVNQSQIDFLMGNTSLDKWDAYVAEYLEMGGQEVIDVYTEQLKEVGMIQ